jgi:hypothetical protein
MYVLDERRSSEGPTYTDGKSKSKIDRRLDYGAKIFNL